MSGPSEAQDAAPAHPAPVPRPEPSEPNAGDAAVGRAAAQLDPTVHHPVRLGILTLVERVEDVSFGYLQGALELTAGNLSRNVTVLEDAGLVATTRGFVGKRPRTWVAITDAGRAALVAEQAALRALLDST